MVYKPQPVSVEVTTPIVFPMLHSRSHYIMVCGWSDSSEEFRELRLKLQCHLENHGWNGSPTQLACRETSLPSMRISAAF